MKKTREDVTKEILDEILMILLKLKFLMMMVMKMVSLKIEK